MPTRYDFVLDWTGAKPDPQEHKRALARRRLRAKEAQWAWDSVEQCREASGYVVADHDQQGATAYVDLDQELAPEYDLVSVRVC